MQYLVPSLKRDVNYMNLFKSQDSSSSIADIDLAYSNVQERFIKTFDDVVITSNSNPVLTTYYKSFRDDKLPDLGVAFAQAYISAEFIETTKMPSVYMTDLKT